MESEATENEFPLRYQRHHHHYSKLFVKRRRSHHETSSEDDLKQRHVNVEIQFAKRPKYSSGHHRSVKSAKTRAFTLYKDCAPEPKRRSTVVTEFQQCPRIIMHTIMPSRTCTEKRQHFWHLDHPDWGWFEPEEVVDDDGNCLIRIRCVNPLRDESQFLDVNESNQLRRALVANQRQERAERLKEETERREEALQEYRKEGIVHYFKKTL
jgi:hypothetical protein